MFRYTEGNQDLAGAESEIPVEVLRDIPIIGDVNVITKVFTRFKLNNFNTHHCKEIVYVRHHIT